MSSSVVESQLDDGDYVNSGPALPHVEVNQIQLSVIIRNLCIYTVTELKQFFKLAIPNQRQEMLKLIIHLRNQFLRLYVLTKWVKTIKNYNFHLLIDLLNYLRIKNMNLGQCIWNLKNIVINSTINAKLLKPDLETALEVFTLGSPQIIENVSFFEKLHRLREKTTPSTNYISNELILKRLEDLDVTLSIKIAMCDVPKKFLDGTKSIKDGKWVIEIPGEYELILSTTGDDAPFHLVDLTFLLSSSSANLTNYQTNKLLHHQINNKIKSNTGNILHELEQVLTQKILFLRIFLCKQILDNYNKTKHKFETPLQVLYDESSITLYYWTNSNIVPQRQDCRIYINIRNEPFSEEKLKLTLTWSLEISEQTKQILNIKTVYDENVFENLIEFITSIIDDHVKLLKYNLFKTRSLFFSKIENYDKSLKFDVPVSCNIDTVVDLNIEKRFGRFYLTDKLNTLNSPLLLKKYSDIINKTYLTSREIISVLQNMKVNYAIHILQNMFLKTGWSVYDEAQIDIGSIIDNPKTKKTFIRMKNWPLNWYLVISNEVLSESEIHIQVRIIKLIKENNKWKIKHLSEYLKIDQEANNSSVSLKEITYEKVKRLQNTILSKIINHSILDIFAELKLDVIELSTEKTSLKFLPTSIKNSILSVDSPANSSVFGIKSENYLASKEYDHLVKPLLFLLIKSENDIQLYGSFSDSFDTSFLQKCESKDLEINFIDKKAFYLEFNSDSELNPVVPRRTTNDEMKTSLNKMKQILMSYKSRLQHLMVLTSTITKLIDSFPKENFRIVKMDRDEICFNYLPKFDRALDNSEYDCKIKLDNTKGLNFELSNNNPQKVLNSIIDTTNVEPLDHKSMFKYFHMTSQLFANLENLRFLQKESSNGQTNWNFEFHIHGVSEFKLDYYLEKDDSFDCISLLISILPFSNGAEDSDLQYKISSQIPLSVQSLNKGSSPSNSNISLINSTIQKACFKIIPLDNISDPNFMNGAKSIIKLNDSLSCSGEDIYKVLMYIHKLIVS